MSIEERMVSRTRKQLAHIQELNKELGDFVRDLIHKVDQCDVTDCKEVKAVEVEVDLPYGNLEASVGLCLEHADKYHDEEERDLHEPEDW